MTTATNREVIHLSLKNNSVKNNTIQCDSLGIHYTIECPGIHGIRTVTKWDKNTDKTLPVGQIQYHIASKDMIRVGGGDEMSNPWIPIKEFLRRGNAWVGSMARTFTAENGKEYRWKYKWGVFYLYRDGESGNHIAQYHHKLFRPGKSYLEILDKELLGAMDALILSFLVVEKKRRDRRKRRSAPGGGGGGGE